MQRKGTSDMPHKKLSPQAKLNNLLGLYLSDNADRRRVANAIRAVVREAQSKERAKTIQWCLDQVKDTLGLTPKDAAWTVVTPTTHQLEYTPFNEKEPH